MCFIIFHCFFSQLYGTTESHNVTLVERHGFQEKTRVPREKSGRHSNLIYLVLKPLFKNPGRQFSDFSVFRRCFSLLFSGFLFWRLFSLIFHYFKDVVHSGSMIFNYVLDVFNYFSLIVQCVYMFFIIFHWLFNVLKMFFIIFHCIVG